MSKKALTVRIDEAEHKEIMKHLIDEGISFNEYVLKLIRKDMTSFPIDKNIHEEQTTIDEFIQ